MRPVDAAWLEDVLLELLRTSTEVPGGSTEILPGDLRIARAVENVVLPRIEELSPQEIRRHPAGDLAARFGPDGDDGVFVQTYIVSQHANLMAEPLAGTIVDGALYGREGRCALGQGATQNKGPMASAFAAVRAAATELERPLWLAVNTEGKSSHDGSRRIFEDLGVTAAYGVVAFGTDLRVSLGNRGRVDVRITVRGTSAHSSQPWLATNPIEGAVDVVHALRSAPLGEPHPTLGPATVTPYQFACRPIAPHTIPEQVAIVADRRLLPGESADRVVEGLARHLVAEAGHVVADLEAGASMLPAAVDPEAPVVRALLYGIERATAAPGETFWSPNAFDAGYACARGIPTPMFGPGKRSFVGEGLVGADLVPIHDCEVAAGALGHAIAVLAGPS